MAPKISLKLAQMDEVEIRNLLTSNVLTPKTGFKLNTILKLANPALPADGIGLSRTSRAKWIKKFSCSDQLSLVINQTKAEAKLISRATTGESIQSPECVAIAKAANLPPKTLTNIKNLLENLLPSENAVASSIKRLLEKPLKRDASKPEQGESEHPSQEVYTVRANIADLGGIYYDGKNLVAAIAIHGTKSFATRIYRASQLPFDLSMPPHWSRVSTYDMLSDIVFRRLDVSYTRIEKISEKVRQEYIESWLRNLRSSYSSEWIFYIIGAQSLKSRFLGHVFIAQDHVHAYLGHLFCRATLSLATAGIFPSVRHWLARLPDFRSPDLALPVTMVGSDEKSFEAFQHRQVAGNYWAVEGSVFHLTQKVHQGIRLLNKSVYLSAETRPHIESFGNDHVWIDPLPGVGFTVPVRGVASSDKLEQEVRKKLRETGQGSRVVYSDGITDDSDVTSLPDFMGVGLDVGSTNQTQDNKTEHKLKALECRLLPRRLLFRDSTEEVKKLRRLSESPRIEKQWPMIHFLDQYIVYDATDVFLAIMQTFSRDYYEERVAQAQTWQEVSLRRLAGSEFDNPDWLPPKNLPWSDPVEWWADTLSYLDKRELDRGQSDAEYLTLYKFGISLGQLWPHRPNFANDLVIEKLKAPGGSEKFWTPNLRNVFASLDADFLLYQTLVSKERTNPGYEPTPSEVTREMLLEQAKDCVEAIHAALYEMCRQTESTFVDPIVGGVWGELKAAGFPDDFLEELFYKVAGKLARLYGKVTRMAVENMQRQVLANFPAPDPRFVLSRRRLAMQFARTVDRALDQEAKEWIESGKATVSLDELLKSGKKFKVASGYDVKGDLYGDDEADEDDPRRRQA